MNRTKIANLEEIKVDVNGRKRNVRNETVIVVMKFTKTVLSLQSASKKNPSCRMGPRPISAFFSMMTSVSTCEWRPLDCLEQTSKLPAEVCSKTRNVARKMVGDWAVKNQIKKRREGDLEKRFCLFFLVFQFHFFFFFVYKVQIVVVSASITENNNYWKEVATWKFANFHWKSHVVYIVWSRKTVE